MKRGSPEEVGEGAGQAGPPRGRCRGEAGAEHAELSPGGAQEPPRSLGEMLRWEPQAWSPWGASTRDVGSGLGQALTSVLSPGRLSQALGAWASTGAGKGDVRSHARGVGGPGSDPEKQWSKDPGKDDRGGSAATGDPGPALEDHVSPQAEVLTDHPPGFTRPPPVARGRWTQGQGQASGGPHQRSPEHFQRETSGQREAEKGRSWALGPARQEKRRPSKRASRRQVGWASGATDRPVWGIGSDYVCLLGDQSHQGAALGSLGRGCSSKAPAWGEVCELCCV